MLNDPLANALSLIRNAEKSGKTVCTIEPVSTLLENVLTILHEHQYLGEIKKEKTPRGVQLTIPLLGNINLCGAIKPRFSARKDTIEKFEKQFLPASEFGILILTTPKGVMTHKDAKKKGLGGRLLAYCY